MQKAERQKAILMLVQSATIRTQAELAEHMRRLGMPVTQATISRDIAELQLARRSGHYVAADEAGAPAPQVRGDARLRMLLHELNVRIRPSLGVAVLVTEPGGAQPIASALDVTGWPEVAGTVAGDDTIFVALGPDKDAYKQLIRRLQALGVPMEERTNG